MLKRLAVILSVLVLVLGVSAVPAQATVFGCPDAGWLCFYNYQSYDTRGGIYGWNLRTGFGACHVLPTSGAPGWTAGKVYNAASSLLINNSGTNTLPGLKSIYFFDSNACNASTDYFFVITFNSGDLTGIPVLANFKPDGPTGWNDRIGSFKIVNS